MRGANSTTHFVKLCTHFKTVTSYLQAELKGRCKAVIIVLEKIDEVLKDGSKSAAAVEKPKPVAPPPVIAALPPASKVPVSQSHSLEV